MFEWIGFGRRNDYWWMPKRERPYRRPWAARIIGTDIQQGLAREFINGVLDFSQSDPSGRHGVRVIYMVDEAAVYEVNYPVDDGWKRKHCYLLHDGETWQELTKDEAIAWANAV
ncbi:MAG: hypothetical protein PHQ43_12905 [Dehalococcoidales bacterium]|nr:hypothetical protein [Dehalococcoidales bacterium]